jgi:multidrug transporter EmrE-like cation transporter
MITVILWLILSVSLFGVGEYLSKKFSLAPSISLTLSIITMYALGALAWLPAIYKGQYLSTIGTMWNLLSMIMTLVIGIVIFNEQLTTIQIVGIGFALTSLIMLSI